MARRTGFREQRQPRKRVIGAGITELWYLKHLKMLLELNIDLQPRLFGDESIHRLNQLIEDGLRDGCPVICLFDEDVSQWNQTVRLQIEELHRKYDKDSRVILGSSMPSIEYWFLLHYEATNRHFNTSNDVIRLLQKYIPHFDKSQHFLSQNKWVKEMTDDGKMAEAIARAKRFGHDGASYSDVWQAIEIMRKD